MPLFVAALLAIALMLLVVALWQALFVVWPEVRPLLRLQCLALRTSLSDAGVEVDALPSEPTPRSPRRSPLTKWQESQEAEAIRRERVIEEWLQMHGLYSMASLPEGWAYRDGEVIPTTSARPLEPDGHALPLLHLR